MSDLGSVSLPYLDQPINKDHDSHPGFPLSRGRLAGPVGQKTSALSDSELQLFENAAVPQCHCCDYVISEENNVHLWIRASEPPTGEVRNN